MVSNAAGKGDDFKGSQIKFRESVYFCSICGKGPSACKCKKVVKK